MEELTKIQSTKGVKEAIGTTICIVDVQDKVDVQNNATSFHSLIIAGLSGKSLVNNTRVPGVGQIQIIEGRLPTEGTHEIIITKDYADGYNVKVGSNITSHLPGGSDYSQGAPTVNFTVVGIVNGLYSGNSPYGASSSNAIISLNVANEILYNSTTPKFNYVHVKADPDQINQTKAELKQSNPNYKIFAEPSDKFVNMIGYYILLFVGIGTLIILFATLRSISERTREIGVLKTIGWSNKRVMSMILIETITQSLTAWVISIILALAVMSRVSALSILKYLKADVNTLIYFLGITLLLSLLMSIIGSIIPLIRVARLKPTEALQYE